MTEQESIKKIGQSIRLTRSIRCSSFVPAHHLMVKRDDMDNEQEMINCHFCQKIHHYPEDGNEFPIDTSIPMLLNIKHSSI